MVSRLRLSFLAALVLAGAAVPTATASAKQTTPKPQIGPAYVYTFKYQSFADGWCTGGTGGYTVGRR